MATTTPGASASFPGGQKRQQFQRNWGNYASAATLPNAAGNILAAADFRLEAGDQAYVVGSGQFSCTSAGTAGGGDATWVLIPSGGAGGGTDNHIVRWDGTSAFQDGVAIETDAGQIYTGDGTPAAPAWSFVANQLLGVARGTSDGGSLDFGYIGGLSNQLTRSGLWGAGGGIGLGCSVGETTALVAGFIQTTATPSVSIGNFQAFGAYINFVGAGTAQIGVQEYFQVNQTAASSFVAHQINLRGAGGAGAPTYGSAGGFFIDALSNTATQFSVSAAGAIATTAVTPAALAAGNIDNYAGFGTSGFGRVTPDGGATSTIRGILATNIRDGHELTLVNIGAAIFTINHQDVGSTAANRIITATGAPVVLTTDDTLILKYDLTTARWRQITSVA